MEELRRSQNEQVLSGRICERNIPTTLVLQEAALTLRGWQSLALRCVVLLEGEGLSGAPDWSAAFWCAFFHSTLHTNLAALAMVLASRTGRPPGLSLRRRCEG